MKGIALVCLLAVAAVALATDSESTTEDAVPTLPGLGSPCLPRRAPVNVRWQHRFEKPAPQSFRGLCVKDAACSPLNAVHGYCAGIGVTCCKGGAAKAAAPVVSSAASAPLRPTLQATASPCTTKGGVCKDKSTCTGTTTSGLCPGTPNNILCCIPKPVTPTVPTTPTRPPTTPTTPSSSWTAAYFATKIPIPAGINKGLQFPSAAFQTSMLGTPGCPLTAACFSCGCNAGSRITSLTKTAKVTDTVSITGIKPFVDAVKRAFDAMAAAGGEAAAARLLVHSAGGLCCRAIKKPNGTPASVHSNHSWGLAVDFYFGTTVDTRGDGKTQRGLAVMQPYFNAQGLYWAGGYSGATEDAMHFEAAQSTVTSWRAQKLL